MTVAEQLDLLESPLSQAEINEAGLEAARAVLDAAISVGAGRTVVHEIVEVKPSSAAEDQGWGPQVTRAEYASRRVDEVRREHGLPARDTQNAG